MDHQKNNRFFKILLVDDRPENIISLEAMLDKDGREFLYANSGNEALKMVLKNEDIGLIMLDVQMPDIDGFEVARILKSNSRTKEISIIFVTAINKEERYVLQGFKAGAVDYLQKPLDVSVSQAKVDVFEKLYFYQDDLRQSLRETASINGQLEKFVFMVSHDLKSPLATIILQLSAIKNDNLIASNFNLQNKIEVIDFSANHLSQMITSILEYSRQSFTQQTMEEVNVFDLVNQVVFILAPPPSVNILVDENLPVIHTRKLKLQQVFQNLVGNAIKYLDKADGIIEIGFRAEESFYVFFVSDNGPGIKPEDAHRIFQLFETSINKSSRESSTGVGLNVLKMLVEEQGGKIWVESKHGQGSIFYFQWRK